MTMGKIYFDEKERLAAQLETLEELRAVYPHRTIENIIANVRARLMEKGAEP